MVTHLIIYFTTSVPSALFLFYHFTYLHGIIHFVMQFYYLGTYTLMMHQHIHGGGVLQKRPLLRVFDTVFPYITDPLMGHTWNSYYYHHVKHHHVEGNGPDDLSSTIRYQRDNIWHFLHYIGRFYFLVWLDLPLYFLRKGRLTFALKGAFWELMNYSSLLILFLLNSRPTFFVFLLPLGLLRAGLMVGNWGQHALVDADEPDSDYRSSITLIDVPVSHDLFSLFTYSSTPFPLSPTQHTRKHRHSTYLPLTQQTEQPILLQRRVPHVAPPEPAAALARAPGALFGEQGDVQLGARARLPQHRLPRDHGAADAAPLRAPRPLPRAHRRAPDRHDHRAARRHAKALHPPLQRGGDQREVWRCEGEVGLLAYLV